MKAINIFANGGPEVLEWTDAAVPPPGPAEVRLRHTAIGLNFSDINLRNGGFYVPGAPQFPITLGNEAAGVIESVGAGVASWRVGERVAYAGTGGLFFENTGAYAQQRNVPADCLVRLPDDVSDPQAAAPLLKGLTASVIVHRCHHPGPGEAVLIHAAASGVGSLLTQWCHARRDRDRHGRLGREGRVRARTWLRSRPIGCKTQRTLTAPSEPGRPPAPSC